MKKLFVFVLIIFFGTGESSQLRAGSINDSALIQNDRWLEIDLYWFDKNDIQGSVDLFWQRFHPLFKNVGGWRGIVLNVGWLTDYVTNWRGNLSDTISIVKGTEQQDWFSVRGHLTGSISQKYQQWNKRFAKPANFLRKKYEDWTYRDLKILAASLRKIANDKYQFDNIKVGSFVVGWKFIYGSKASGWSLLHREAFTALGKRSESNASFDVTALLKKDSIHYGAFPDGIQEGLPVYDFFGQQWGSLSREVGLDVIVLRDRLLGIGVYGRSGPFGKILSADTAENARIFRAHANLVKVTKQSNPSALVIGYSSAASAIADLRTNAFDLEGVAREGYLDAFIDQTWAGAWNEVGIRHSGDDFWNQPALGWTYQLAYMLMHGAALADTKTRHYQLTETFDAWESWDVIHTAPERLKWGIWAFSHAAIKTPKGLKMPAGDYISWANQGTRLLSDEDVSFLANEIDSAYSDAAKIKEVFGPTLVYNSAALNYQNRTAPDKSIKEWIDEYAGSLMKWGLPILSATRMEYLDQIKTDLAILQTPVELTEKEKKYILDEMDKNKPFVIIGSPAGGIDPAIAAKGGILSNDRYGSWKKYGFGAHENEYSAGLDSVFSLRQFYTMNHTVGKVNTLYSALDTLPSNGKTELKLMVDDGSNGRSFDYVDWVNMALTTSKGEKMHLSKMKPFVAGQDYGEVIRNANAIGESITINGQSSTDGIGMHSNAQAIYHLPPGEYTRLEGLVGLDDKQGRKGQVRAKIFINDNLVYESGLINKNNPSVKLGINIPDEPKKVNPQYSPVLVSTPTNSGKKILTWDPPEFNYDYGLPVINNMGNSVVPYVLSVRVMQDYLKATLSPYIGNIKPQKPIWIGAWQLNDGSYRLLTADLEEGFHFSSDSLTKYPVELPEKWGPRLSATGLWKKQDAAIQNHKINISLNYMESQLIKIASQ